MKYHIMSYNYLERLRMLLAETKLEEKNSGLNCIPTQLTTVMLPSALLTELLTEVSCLAQGQKSVYT